MEEVEELLPWQCSSPGHLYHRWAGGDPWRKWFPTYFTKAGKSPRTHRWRGALGNVPSSLKWMLEVAMATWFLAHQTMKEGEQQSRQAAEEPTAASPALGSHSGCRESVRLRSEASLGAQPFPVVSVRTNWVRALFRERTVPMKQRTEMSSWRKREDSCCPSRQCSVIGKHLNWISLFLSQFLSFLGYLPQLIII